MFMLILMIVLCMRMFYEFKKKSGNFLSSFRTNNFDFYDALMYIDFTLFILDNAIFLLFVCTLCYVSLINLTVDLKSIFIGSNDFF